MAINGKQSYVSSNNNLLIKERFVSSAFSGDTDTIKALADPSFELHEGSGLPFAGVYQGAEGFLRFLAIFNETFQIERLEPIRAYEAAEPDWLAFEFDLRGVVRSTGALFESTLIEIWKFKDGRVLSIKPHYFNSPFHSPAGAPGERKLG